MGRKQPYRFGYRRDENFAGHLFDGTVGTVFLSRIACWRLRAQEMSLLIFSQGSQAKAIEAKQKSRP